MRISSRHLGPYCEERLQVGQYVKKPSPLSPLLQPDKDMSINEPAGLVHQYSDLKTSARAAYLNRSTRDFQKSKAFQDFKAKRSTNYAADIILDTSFENIHNGKHLPNQEKFDYALRGILQEDCPQKAQDHFLTSVIHFIDKKDKGSSKSLGEQRVEYIRKMLKTAYKMMENKIIKTPTKESDLVLSAGTHFENHAGCIFDDLIALMDPDL